MENKTLYLKQVVIKSDKGLPDLLRMVADYIEENNQGVWDLLIDTEPDEFDRLFARLILEGFVDVNKLTA